MVLGRGEFTGGRNPHKEAYFLGEREEGREGGGQFPTGSLLPREKRGGGMGRAREERRRTTRAMRKLTSQPGGRGKENGLHGYVDTR